MSLKTAKIGKILEHANFMLRDGSGLSHEEKSGIALLVESFLHESGNYNGFYYKKRNTDGELLTTDGYEYTRFYLPSKRISRDYRIADAERINAINGHI